MVLETITIGVIGLTYATGDEDRKAKMRKIGSEIVDVAGETLKDVIDIGKSLTEKVRYSQMKKENI